MTVTGEITTFAALIVSNSCQKAEWYVEKSFIVRGGVGRYGVCAGGFHAG